jgi:HKD family nuclease
MNKLNLIGTDSESVLFKEPVSGSLILSFTVDIIFYEQILVRRLMKCGSTNNLLLADQNQILWSQNNQASYLQPDKYDYLIQPISLGNLFHPKTIWLKKASETLLLIGSGNVGYGGMSNNMEVFTVFSSKNESDRAILSQFVDYTKQLLTQINIEKQFQDKIENLFNQNWPTGNIEGNNYNSILVHNLQESIFDQLINQVKSPRKIHLIAPFYDKDLRFVKKLADHYKLPVNVYFQENYTTFPKDISSDSIIPYSFVHSEMGKGNLHAKMIIFENNDTFDVLFGSPNATEAAMLKSVSTGNSELAVIQSDLSSQLLPAYLPDNAKLAEIESIHPNFIGNSSTINILIIAAYLNRNNYLEILTSPKLNVKIIHSIITDVEEFRVPHERVSFEDEKILIHWPYQQKAPNWLFLSLTKGISNKILVFNQQKTDSLIDNQASRQINSLQAYLSDESLSELAYITSILPIYTITTQRHSKQTEISDYATGEIEQIESTIEKDSIDFYVRVHEISLPNGRSIAVHSNDLTLSNLLKTIKKIDKYSLSISYSGPSLSLTLDASKVIEENGIQPKQVEDYEKLIDDYINEVKWLSGLYKKGELNDKPDNVYLEYAVQSAQKLLLFLYLISGIQFHLSHGGQGLIQLASHQLYKLLTPIVEIINNWWDATAAHKELFGSKRMHLFICQLWVTSIFTLGLMHSAYQKKYKHTQDINYHKYGYVLINSINSLLNAISSLQLDKDTIEGEIGNANHKLMVNSWQLFGTKESYKEMLRLFYASSSNYRGNPSRHPQLDHLSSNLASRPLSEIIDSLF